MKLKYSFEFVDLGDEIIAVPVGQSPNQLAGILKLNKSCAEVIKLIDRGCSEQTIIEHLCDVYENDTETIIRYVQKTIEKLREYDLICN